MNMNAWSVRTVGAGRPDCELPATVSIFLVGLKDWMRDSDVRRGHNITHTES